MKKINFIFFLHFGVIFLFFLIAFVWNTIPYGSFIASGDFSQLIEPHNTVSRYFYTFFFGQGQFNPLTVSSPFAIFQGILYGWGLNASQIFSVIFFGFLSLSFYSFFFALKIFNLGKRYYLSTWMSLFYACNIFTFAIMSYSWGVTNHLLIYVYIPLLLALFTRLILSPNLKNLSYFLLFSLLSLTAYNNFAFFAALMIIEGLIWLSILLQTRTGWMRRIAMYIGVVIFQFLLIVMVFMPLFEANKSNIDQANSTKAFGGNAVENFIRPGSSHPLNSFQLITNDFYFPSDTTVNPYSNDQLLSFIAKIFPLIPVVLILTYLIKIFSRKGFFHKDAHNTLFLYFLIPFLFLTFLVARLTPPFDAINIFFYQKTLALFRSPDKLFVFYPFILIFLTTIVCDYFSFKKWGYTVLILFILTPGVFFLIGGVGKILNQEQTYFGGSYTRSVSIPKAYRDIVPVINKIERQTTIISLPYSVLNSLNWSNYPKWHFLGSDVLGSLYNKAYITANTYDHPTLETQLSFKNINENPLSTKEDLLFAIKKFSGEYVIFHNDIDPGWSGKSGHIRDLLSLLVGDRSLNVLASNDFFDLYHVNPRELSPMIALEVQKTRFEKISPVHYKIEGKGLSQITNLIFHQSYNKLWNIYLEPYQSVECLSGNSYTGALDVSNGVESTRTLYTIKKGDDYNLIAQNYPNMTESMIEQANSLIEKNRLRAGMQILLPIEVRGKVNGNYNVTECPSENRFYAGGELAKLWEKPIFDDTHKMVYDYANQWTIDPEYIKKKYPKNYYKENADGSIDVRMTLYFKPQSYFYLGLIISGLTFFSCLAYLIVSTFKRKRIDSFYPSHP